MSLIIDGVTVKKILYNGTSIKKAYCDGVQIFSADHTVTYIIKGQSWTAVVEDEADAITATANAAAAAKMGSGDTFLGWTTVNGGTTPYSTIPCSADGMKLYGIWKHAHVGTNTTKAGCYQGAGSTTNQHSIINLGGVTTDSCGCSHQSWTRKCNVCGVTWGVTCNNSIYCTNSPKHQNGACTYPGDRSSCSNGHPGTVTTYAVSCGKSAGTFCG